MCRGSKMIYQYIKDHLQRLVLIRIFMAEARKTAFINKVTVTILILTTNRPPSCGRTGAQRAATQTGSVASPPPKTTRWSYHLDHLDHVHHKCGRPHHHVDPHGPPGLCRHAFQLRLSGPVGSCGLQQDRHQLRLRAQTNLLVGTIERKQITNLMQAYELYGVKVYGRQKFNWLLLVVKNGYFRLTVRGGVNPVGPDRKQMWKFWPFFFHWNLILWYLKHILSHCKGPQKCIFHE